MRRHAYIEVPTEWGMFTPEGEQRVTDLAQQVTDDMNALLSEPGDTRREEIDRILANLISGYIAFFSDDDVSEAGDSVVGEAVYFFYVTLWTVAGLDPTAAQDAYEEQYDQIYLAVYDEGSPYSEKYASVETERADLAEPILRLMYEDIQQGELTRPEVEQAVDDYVDMYLDEALEKPEEFFETDWDLLRDVLHQAAREQLQRSMMAGVEANWNLLDAWLESDAELA